MIDGTCHIRPACRRWRTLHAVPLQYRREFAARDVLPRRKIFLQLRLQMAYHVETIISHALQLAGKIDATTVDLLLPATSFA